MIPLAQGTIRHGAQSDRKIVRQNVRRQIDALPIVGAARQTGGGVPDERPAPSQTAEAARCLRSGKAAGPHHGIVSGNAVEITYNGSVGTERFHPLRVTLGKRIKSRQWL